MSANQLLNMTTAFFVSEEYSRKEKVNGFVEWLTGEGYSEVKTDYYNLYGAFYIDIASKTFARANAEIQLADIVGHQGLYYEDFKEIHRIFARTADKENTWRFRLAYLPPLPMYLTYKERKRKEREKKVNDYFSKNPSFEEWCEDVFKAIKSDPWYIEHMPDYSREYYLECLNDHYIHRDMVDMYEHHEMPDSVAGQWDLITF